MMKEYIETLIHLGFTNDQAESFIKEVVAKGFSAAKQISNSNIKMNLSFDKWFNIQKQS